MAITGGGGKKRAAAVKAAKARVPAHGYAQSRTNFQAGKPAARGAALLPSINQRAYNPQSFSSIKTKGVRLPQINVNLPKIGLPSLPFDPGSLIRADAKAIDNAVSGRRR